jgi:hypothetical protein
MKWILILAIQWGGVASMVTTEFNDWEGCEIAKTKFIKESSTSYPFIPQVVAICAPKSKPPME